MSEISRRQLLRNSLLGSLVAAPVLGAVCKLTPGQGEGPYYPESDLERDADLLHLNPNDPSAVGQQIYVVGKITSTDCKPIEGALVEIWQACFSGKYNHSEDGSDLELDPNFQYWGRSRTKADGSYKFRTILPGRYPNGGGGVYRPPHIHFKVHAPKFRSLTTQMYFDPKSLDDAKEAIEVAKWNAYENVTKALTVLFEPMATGGRQGSFDITLRSIT